jgi:hypothetical protein
MICLRKMPVLFALALLSRFAVPVSHAEGTATANPLRHRFLAVDESRGQLHYVDQLDPTRDWTVKLPAKCRDLQLIGGNQVMLSSPDGYWVYDLGTQKLVKQVADVRFKGAASARRRVDGHTVIGCNLNGITVYELDARDQVLRTACFPDLNTFRLLRLTPQGTILFGANEKLVIEATLDGKVTKQVTVPDGRHLYQVLRRPDGHLLVATGYGAYVGELDQAGTVVKRYGGNPPPPGMLYQFFCGMQALKNGDLVVCNWTGHGAQDSEKGDQLLQFDPAGNLVWKWHDAARAGTIHGIIVLDDLDTGVLNDDLNGTLGPVQPNP